MELDNLQDNIVLVAALAALAGLGIGMLLTYLLIGRGPSKSELTGKLAAVEEEFETHKHNVDKHFATTSELVNELTESYVKVYKHLSEGAEQLGGVVDMRHRLTLDDGSADNTSNDSGESAVIEGALATAAVGMAGAVSAQTEDPEFTVSDAAVEETLNELEANATSSSSAAGNLSDGDAEAATDTPDETSAPDKVKD